MAVLFNSLNWEPIKIFCESAISVITRFAKNILKISARASFEGARLKCVLNNQGLTFFYFLFLNEILLI